MFLVNRYGNLVGQTFIRLEEAGILADGTRSVSCSFTSMLYSIRRLTRFRISVLLKFRASHLLLYDPIFSFDS
jgi:hypothetical protein